MRLFLIAIFTVLVSIACSFGIYAQSSICEQLNDNETTRQGYSELIVFKEKNTFQVIRGISVLGGQPLENVFVEIFPYKSDKRIAGCRTSENGKFSFQNLNKGKYKIKLSKDGGFKTTEIHIKISPKSKNNTEIIGVVEVGT